MRFSKMKESALNLLNNKIEEAEQAQRLDCWAILENDGRELIGITYAFYRLNLINETERKKYVEIGYNFEAIGSGKGYYQLINGRLSPIY